MVNISTHIISLHSHLVKLRLNHLLALGSHPHSVSVAGELYAQASTSATGRSDQSNEILSHPNFSSDQEYKIHTKKGTFMEWDFLAPILYLFSDLKRKF